MRSRRILTASSSASSSKSSILRVEQSRRRSLPARSPRPLPRSSLGAVQAGPPVHPRRCRTVGRASHRPPPQTPAHLSRRCLRVAPRSPRNRALPRPPGPRATRSRRRRHPAARRPCPRRPLPPAHHPARPCPCPVEGALARLPRHLRSSRGPPRPPAPPPRLRRRRPWAVPRHRSLRSRQPLRAVRRLPPERPEAEERPEAGEGAARGEAVAPREVGERRADEERREAGGVLLPVVEVARARPSLRRARLRLPRLYLRPPLRRPHRRVHRSNRRCRRLARSTPLTMLCATRKTRRSASRT